MISNVILSTTKNVMHEVIWYGTRGYARRRLRLPARAMTQPWARYTDRMLGESALANSPFGKCIHCPAERVVLPAT
jgi:hypothetical protein